MTFKEGQSVDLDALKGAARKAGFELLGTDLVVTGELIQATGPDGEETLGLRVTQTGQTFFLNPGDSEETQRNYTEVARWAGDKTARIRVRGRGHSHRGADPGLAISTFEIIKEESK